MSFIQLGSLKAEEPVAKQERVTSLQQKKHTLSFKRAMEVTKPIILNEGQTINLQKMNFKFVEVPLWGGQQQKAEM